MEVVGFGSLTMVGYVRYQDVLWSVAHVSLEAYSLCLAQHCRAALGQHWAIAADRVSRTGFVNCTASLLTNVPLPTGILCNLCLC